MVVVVADPILVSGGGAGGLDAADQAFFGEKGNGIVNRLSGNRADLSANIFGDSIGGAVRSPGDRSQNGQTLGRYRKAVFAEKFERACH